jgi:hypothetical protein
MRLTYRFVDGSIDDETTTYRQEGTFRLVRNHHIQKGPFFAKPIDFAVEAATGTVTTRTTDKNSKIHAESEHMDMLDAQAFKRACSCFGLGRYLYRFEETWVQLNRRGEPAALPALPEWALPPGVTVQQAGGKPVDVRGPVDHRLTAEIESFLSTLGVDIYQEILRRTGHSNNARTIPNADRQKNVVEWMEAAARGFERLHGLVEIAGDARFIATMDNLKFSTTTCLPSLAAMKRLIDELESITGQQVA